MEQEKKSSKTRLCHTKDCCPTVRINRGKIVITDDFGGKIRLTSKQWQMLKNLTLTV